MTLPPGPKKPALLQAWDWATRPLELLQECHARYGTPFTLRFPGQRALVVVSDPKTVQSIFTEPGVLFLSGRANQNFKHFVGENTVFVLDGAQHKRHRKLLHPPFLGERMRAYGSLISELTLEDMRKWPTGKPISFFDAMTRVTLQIIIRAIFGIQDPAKISKLIEEITRLTTGAWPALLAFLPILRVDLGSWSPWGRFIATRSRIDEILFQEIQNAGKSPHLREDILAKLIEEGRRREDELSSQEIRDELLTLLGAGHETTTAGLAWALQWILGQESIRSRIVEEIDTHGILFDPIGCKRLQFTESSLYETLRLHPPLPIVIRWLSSPHPLGPYELPAATLVCPSPYLTQRSPEIYPDPDVFRPERFLEGRPNPFHYYPFGGGIRTCIGMSFALYEMRIILTTILKHTHLQFPESPTHKARRKGIIVIPEHRTPIILDSWR
ncbi:MAG: cytochrome P450 [Planctomycetota bacterium]|jgi:unspecific monooxygenase|nr:cytochrome P450 [Planctomycetota bacterium]